MKNKKKKTIIMFRVITTITCLTIILLYLLFVSITYPYVCWKKHRPSDDTRYFLPPTVTTLINKRSTNVCSNKYQLDLMPIPLKTIISDTSQIIHIPSIIRLQSKYSIPFPTLNTSENAAFILSIDCESNLTMSSYPDLEIDESYQLNITSKDHASLFAKTYVGIIRGLSTFEQLQRQENIPIPLVIFDQPQFIWRGLMLDVARHFISLTIIKRTIDLMKLVKMNVLHLHLSDDQGFRFESKRFPLLHDRKQFYSQSDIRDLVEYARQRAIRIVPEFDMPGHTAAWFVGYPHLASSQQSSYDLENAWGVRNATMDATRESTYDFLDKLFAEITELFPDPYLHIGGDECVPHEWMNSKDIQKFIQERRLNGHEGLQAYFTNRVEILLDKHKRFMMGWDEISTSNLSRNSVIQSWRNKESLIAAAHRGYRAILSQGFYLDHMSSAGYHYSNELPIKFKFDKILQKRILGGEACLWTEYISSNMVHSRVWPRTAAIAERLWSSRSDQIECMYDRLAIMDKRFFHPDDEEYKKDLSTLTSNRTALRLLADLCEPLGLQGRNLSRNYTSQTPLNRFVDILKPESEHIRQIMKITNISLLYSIFLSWKMNQVYLHSNETEILQLSENLAQLAEIGIRLLKLFDTNQQRRIVSMRWYYYQVYILKTLEYQVSEIRLAGVRVVRDLLEQFDTCSFDLINLSLILFFPMLIILVQRISFIRRRFLLPCLLLCFSMRSSVR